MQIFPSIDMPAMQASGSGTAAVMMRSKTSSDFDSLLGGASRDEATKKISKNSPSEAIEPTDILYLQALLGQMGMPKEQLANLGSLMVSGKKSTSADLEAALTGKTYKELSSLTKMDMETFLQKLGFSGPETDTLLAGLANGGTAAVWKTIQQKLSGHTLEDLSISKEEFSALGDALRLNDKAKNALEKILEQMNGKGSEEKAAEALALLQKAMDQQASADSQIKKALEKVMPDVLERMEQRLAGQDQASARITKDEQYLSAMMHENSFNTTKANMAREEAELQNQERDAKSRKDATTRKLTIPGEKKTSRENHIESLIDRMSSKIAVSPQTLTSAGINGAEQGNSVAHALRQGSLSSSQAESVLMQMEKGMLQSLADGTKQLSLQLHPEELGTVNIILSVRSGEVSASIRPESHEVTRAVEEQVHKIQAALEQQGFKVQRLEVQTQLPENREFMNWQGTDQHNQEFMQRENARRTRLARIRTTQSASLAQNMHGLGVREKVSQSGLNLIA